MSEEVGGMSDPLELELQVVVSCLVWVVEIKLRLSSRTHMRS